MSFVNYWVAIANHQPLLIGIIGLLLGWVWGAVVYGLAGILGGRRR